MRYTYDPLGWEAWVEERLPTGRLEGLKLRARMGLSHVDYDELCAVLKSLDNRSA
jgi:hypothetical protein